MSSHYPRIDLKRSLVVLSLVICITINIAGVILYERYENIKATDSWITHTNEVITQIERYYGDIEKAIAFERGFLLTGLLEFQSDYNKAIEDIAVSMRAFELSTKDNPAQQERVQSLRQNTDTIIALMNQNIAQRQKNGQFVPNTNDDAMTVRGVAKKIQSDIGAMLDEETKLLVMRSERQRTQEHYYTSTLLIVSLASIGVLLIANILILGMAAKQRATEQNLSQATQNLLATKERMELALRGTSDGIFDWNTETGEVYYTHRFREMLGYNDDDFPSTTDAYFSKIYPDDRDRVKKHIDDFLNRKIPDYRIEFRIQHKDGTWRWHLARATALFDETDQAYRMVGAHTDITTDKLTEERLRASNRELENFTYIASHDLRSPLVNLKGFASEIEVSMEPVTAYVERTLSMFPGERTEPIREAIETDIPQALDFIKTSVTKMEKLTKAILELSRVGRRQLHFEPLNIQSIVEGCVRALQHQIAQKNIQVIIGDLPDVVGDPVAIEQVFANILDNAVKYLDDNRPGRIEVSGTRNIMDTVYKIADNGRGIRQEDLNKVFELFKRAGKHDNIPGEGMGMSYVQTILRRHGGSIWVESELGKGTIFYFSILNQPDKERRDV